MRNILKSMLYVATIACLMLSVTAHADSKKKKSIKLQADLSTAQEVQSVAPGLITSATITAKFSKDLSSVDVKLRVKGGANVVAAHFHCARAGVKGPVAVTITSALGPLPFDGTEASGTLTNADFLPMDSDPCPLVIGRPVNNIASLLFAMQDGLIYTNVHTFPDNPGGEVRGQMR